LARILIVEDDRPFAEALIAMLRLEGHELLAADNAEEGIRLGLAQHPDVVVADWMLKDDLHGGEVCRRIRVGCPHTKAIIMTGHPTLAAAASRWCMCIETVVEKPFRKEQIIEAINQALSGMLQETT
jgi:DNA-binding NtrC family response regulator